MKAVYTAVLTPMEDDSGFYVRVPDLPHCITTGSSLSDAIDMATDAASVWLCSAEDAGDTLPSPSLPADVPHQPGDICTLIQVDTVLYRAATDTRAVRKTVSLPAWMSALASARGINCSQVLQDALREKLGVSIG